MEKNNNSNLETEKFKAPYRHNHRVLLVELELSAPCIMLLLGQLRFSDGFINTILARMEYHSFLKVHLFLFAIISSIIN